MAVDEPVPDELRCKRTDGRHWRCKRQVMDGKLLCEIHSAQVKLRNVRIQVPDSLKLQRSNRTSQKKTPHGRSDPAPASADDPGDGEIRVNGREHLDRKNKRKRSSASDAAEADDLAERNAKSKAEELLKALSEGRIEAKKKMKKAKAEESVEKEKKKKKTGKKDVEQSSEEITRELPYGRMAISPMSDSVKAPSAKPIDNAGSPPVKLGLDPPNYRLVDRKFRSKNVEQPPVSTLKAVPFAPNLRGKMKVAGGRGGKKKCHWCQKSRNVSLNKCLSCKKRFFCSDCIKERSIEAREVKLKCPVCHGTCECNACSISHPKDASSEDNLKKQCKMSKYLSLHYMISLVLPILEQINEGQRIELEMEAKLKERSLSEVEILQAEIGEEKKMSCNKCSSFILDMHRSCPSCSYNLCLDCCEVTRDLMLLGTKSSSRKKSSSGGNAHTDEKLVKKSMKNGGSSESDSLSPLSSSRAYSGNLSCPSLELGGCSSSILDLRCVFPLNYTRELEISAKEIILGHESPKIAGPSLHCSLCSAMAREGGNRKELLEACRRKHPGDNFLYSPSIHDDYDTLFVHFQKHWRNFHPVIVRDLLEKASDLTWNPIGMFSSYLKMDLSSSENDEEKAGAPNCMDWYKVEFINKESYNWALKRVIQSSDETLRLKAKLSSVSCQRGFSAHYAEIFNVLPIQEYTNPISGLLNLAGKSTEDPQVSEFSPQVHITCSSAEGIRSADLGDALCHNSHDLVNILVHASDFSPSTNQVNEVKTLIRMKNSKDVEGCNGLDLDNGMAKEHSKITEEEGQPERNVNGTDAASSFSAAIEDPPVGTGRNSTAKPPASETESDSSVMCSGSSDNRDKAMGETLSVDRTEPSTSEKESSEEMPCGIQWDVFRRQDTQKLLEYIQKHSDEFYTTCGSSKQVIEPVIDGSFFLDEAHKMKLKQDFKIEPWTFNQRLGEAVLIPAGCPYQTRNLKSCVNVVLGFVSPEHASECIKQADILECIKLANKLEDLSTAPKAKPSRMEVEKMVINKISKAIEEMRSEASNNLGCLVN